MMKKKKIMKVTKNVVEIIYLLVFDKYTKK